VFDVEDKQWPIVPGERKHMVCKMKSTNSDTLNSLLKKEN